MPKASAHGLLLPILWMTTMSASAQSVDHDRIQALFSLLETPDIVGPSDPAPSAEPTQSQTAVTMTGPTLPDNSSAMTEPAAKSERDGALFAYDAPSGSNCPRDSVGFRAAVDEIERFRIEIEENVGELEQTFDALAEDMIEMRSAEFFMCTDALSSKIEAVSETIADFNAGEQMARVENLGTCAQQAATRIGHEMEAIPVDAPREQLMLRSNLSRQLNDASRQDERLTAVMISMASMRQKQLRISEAVRDFGTECAFSSGDFYGSDMTDYQ
ncbi:hypothetical protein [Roseovarius sp. MBR-79]|jgi:hypothetical protein